jgi:hypothetical protein
MVVVRDSTPITVNLMDLTHSAIPLSYREGCRWAISSSSSDCHAAGDSLS